MANVPRPRDKITIVNTFVNTTINTIVNAMVNTIIIVTCDVALGWMQLKSRTEDALLLTINT